MLHLHDAGDLGEKTGFGAHLTGLFLMLHEVSWLQVLQLQTTTSGREKTKKKKGTPKASLRLIGVFSPSHRSVTFLWQVGHKLDAFWRVEEKSGARFIGLASFLALHQRHEEAGNSEGRRQDAVRRLRPT